MIMEVRSILPLVQVETDPFEGIPLQMTTDCGTETVLVFGFANALR